LYKPSTLTIEFATDKTTVLDVARKTISDNFVVGINDERILVLANS